MALKEYAIGFFAGMIFEWLAQLYYKYKHPDKAISKIEEIKIIKQNNGRKK